MIAVHVAPSADEVAEGVMRWMRLWIAGKGFGTPAAGCGAESDLAFEYPCPLPGCDFPAFRADLIADLFHCPGCGRCGDALAFTVALGLADDRDGAEAWHASLSVDSDGPAPTLDQLWTKIAPLIPSMPMHEVDPHGDPVTVPEYVEGLIGRGELLLLSAKGGTGKTQLMADLCAHLRDRQPFLGRQVLSSPEVLYVSADMTGMANETALHNLFGSTARVVLPKKDGGRFRLDRAPDMDRLIDTIRAAGAGITIVDTYAASTVGLDGQSETDAGLVFEQVRRVRDATGSAFVFLHHTGHVADRARGTTAIVDNVDKAYVLTPSKSGKSDLTLFTEKNRNGAPLVIHLQRAFDDDGRASHWAVERPPDGGSPKTESTRNYEAEVYAHLRENGPASKTKIAKGIKAGETTVGKVVDSMVKAGTLVKQDGRFDIAENVAP